MNKLSVPVIGKEFGKAPATPWTLVERTICGGRRGDRLSWIILGKSARKDTEEAIEVQTYKSNSSDAKIRAFCDG
jgi:hypothetical protein